jgi:hypothetical protein
MTPPVELKPRLKGSFSAFSKLIGHIRFFYLADEIWDGESSLVFSAGGQQLTALTLDDGTFSVRTADSTVRIADEAGLDVIFEKIKGTFPLERHRPFEQLTMNFDDPAKFPCGYRCDMCLVNKKQNENDTSATERFGYWNWLCYHNCLPNEVIERPAPNSHKNVCPGCASTPWKKECKYYNCPTQKGYSGCLECGKYHECDLQKDGLHAGQCNLGMTAEEVTSLVIPYCMKQRFDIYRNSLK